MTTLGQLGLLAAFLSSGYASFACILGWHGNHSGLRRTGHWAAVAALSALALVALLLGWALLVKDFRFAYVAQYSSRDLNWYYTLSAFWVGQAGSLLLWALFLGGAAAWYRYGPRVGANDLREPTFGLLMGYLCFLIAIMVFGADPMEPSLFVPREGAGLSPSLQHPAMLFHPPVVFLGYALWSVPFALAAMALVSGQLDARWTRLARPWSLAGWTVLGIGILLGAEWAYEELGWGGYWAWDPVENGSLIPWLTGTALIHACLAWQHRGVLKKTALVLALATFGLCNFAAFLTRSGIFSSLHAFSRSPIGWMFLLLMLALIVGGGLLIVLRRAMLRPSRPIASLWSREALVAISAVALVLLATVALVGTLAIPLSEMLLGQKMVVGTAFYNNVLIPIGLLLLATTALAPLLRWGVEPNRVEKWALMAATVAAGGAVVAAYVLGMRHPIALAVAWLAPLAPLVFACTVFLDVWRQDHAPLWLRAARTVWSRRRPYAGFLLHLGFVCLAVGVAGSSLGTRRLETTLTQGETIEWAGRTIHFTGLAQKQLPDKIAIEAQLEVSQGDGAAVALRPAQHLYRLQNQWKAQVAIHSTWTSDFYTILHSGEGERQIEITFLENPMMRWMWLSGLVAVLGTLVALFPSRLRARRNTVPPPKCAALTQRGQEKGSRDRSLANARSDQPWSNP